jgi:hypothetical protein
MKPITAEVRASRNKEISASRNQPGGLVGFSERLKTEIRQLQAKQGKPTLSAQAPASLMELLGLRDELTAAPAAKIPSALAALSAQAALGKEIVALGTHPSPAVSKPIMDGLQASLAARLGLEPAAPTCSRAEFDTLSPRQKSEFCKKGGRITPEPTAIVPPITPGATTISRAQFHTLSAADKMAFCKSGGKITA